VPLGGSSAQRDIVGVSDDGAGQQCPTERSFALDGLDRIRAVRGVIASEIVVARKSAVPAVSNLLG